MKQPPHWILILSRAKLMQPFFRCQLNLVSTPQAVSGQIYELFFLHYGWLMRSRFPRIIAQGTSASRNLARYHPLGGAVDNKSGRFRRVFSKAFCCRQRRISS